MSDLVQEDLKKGDKVYLKSGSQEMTVIEPVCQTVMVRWVGENGEKPWDYISAVCLTQTPTAVE